MKIGKLLELIQDEIIVLKQDTLSIEINIKNEIEYSLYVNCEVKGIYHNSYYHRVEIEIE